MNDTRKRPDVLLINILYIVKVFIPIVYVLRKSVLNAFQAQVK